MNYSYHGLSGSELSYLSSFWDPLYIDLLAGANQIDFESRKYYLESE